MAHHLYVYYRIRPEAAAAARRCVDRLQAALEVRTGIRGRMLARCDEPELWMEIYEHVVDRAGFETALLDAVGGADLAPHLAPGSVRKVECFRD